MLQKVIIKNYQKGEYFAKALSRNYYMKIFMNFEILLLNHKFPKAPVFTFYWLIYLITLINFTTDVGNVQCCHYIESILVIQIGKMLEKTPVKEKLTCHWPATSQKITLLYSCFLQHFTNLNYQDSFYVMGTLPGKRLRAINDIKYVS